MLGKGECELLSIALEDDFGFVRLLLELSSLSCLYLGAVEGVEDFFETRDDGWTWPCCLA